MDQFQDGNKSFINGAWTEGETGKTIDTVNPFDRSVIATLSLASAKQLEDAFDIAAKAQKEWAKSSAEDRKAVLTKAKEYLERNREDIILTISRETGGTIIKANIELDAAIAILAEAITYTGELGSIREVPSDIEGKINHIYRLPLGVISSISPFNFPLNLSMRTIAPAIALGNSVVHKPDVQTALSGGSVIAKAFEYAGLPAGVLNVIFADIEEIKDGMLTHPIPRLISFTGSTAVGRHIGEIAGRNFKRMALELGGNNPFAVLSDADTDRAVDAAIFEKFIHQGQTA